MEENTQIENMLKASLW